jgi:elongation factor Ts
MEISAAQVKDLREATGLGMMLCKKALIDAEGDMQKAIENLRKQGQITAQKRAGKAAKEGKITLKIQPGMALVYEVNSETDFVARNDDFVAFVEELGKLLTNEKPANLEAAMKLTSPAFAGRSVSERISDLIGKIGENISFRRFSILSFDPLKHRCFSYLHHNGKIGVLLKLSVSGAEALNHDAVEELGKDLCLQVTAANPAAVGRADIPADIVAKEKEIYYSQAQTSGRPENVWDKIVEGKMTRFYKDSTLNEQEYIRDAAMSVNDRIKQAETKSGGKLSIESFIRYELGAEK